MLRLVAFEGFFSLDLSSSINHLELVTIEFHLFILFWLLMAYLKYLSDVRILTMSISFSIRSEPLEYSRCSLRYVLFKQQKR